MTLSISMIEPGQPWVMMTGRAFGVARLDVDEVDVEAVDLGQELRPRVQPGLDPPRSRSRCSSTGPAPGSSPGARPATGRKRSPSRASASPGSAGGARRSPPGGSRPGMGGSPPRRPPRLAGPERSWTSRRLLTLASPATGIPLRRLDTPQGRPGDARSRRLMLLIDTWVPSVRRRDGEPSSGSCLANAAPKGPQHRKRDRTRLCKMSGPRRGIFDRASAATVG